MPNPTGKNQYSAGGKASKRKGPPKASKNMMGSVAQNNINRKPQKQHTGTIDKMRAAGTLTATGSKKRKR